MLSVSIRLAVTVVASALLGCGGSEPKGVPNENTSKGTAASDEFDCNFTLCNKENPCNRGCRCKYPAFATVGYCVVWYEKDQPIAETESSPPTTAEEFVVASIVAICSDWNPDALRERASSAFLSATSDEEREKELTHHQALGDLITGNKVDVVRGGASGDGTEYVATVKFTKGPAKVHVTLEGSQPDWRLAKFQVESEALAKE